LQAAFSQEGRDSHLVITGGAGFVGGNLACAFKARYPQLRVTCFDNLRRRGSELQLPRLRRQGIEFVHGDVRSPDALEAVGAFDALLECSAEAAVLAGYGAERGYAIETNLGGTVHCLEACLRHSARLIFLSTSRVYPLARLNGLDWIESEARFDLSDNQTTPGASHRGIDLDFPLDGARSLYGATKLASELLIEEYVDAFGLRAVVNRCGVIAGPWQMGKVDQGIASWWMLRHCFGGTLSYIGWGGTGKQVRDFLHNGDLFDLCELEFARIDEISGQRFNVGGGLENSASLVELTEFCRKISGRSLDIAGEAANRPGDIRIYITDNARVTDAIGWKPKRPLHQILDDLHHWITTHPDEIQAALEL
jgi:CDP-paratose 2-epimerase